MKLSLILPTVGRKKELIDFIFSLIKAKDALENSDSVELIIVDQNPTEYGLFISIEKYIDELNINYIHSSQKGLSYNRNIGVKVAKGDFFCFPDDDCTYYPDTLSIVFSLFHSHPLADGLIGRIYDRTNQCNIIRPWPCKNKVINKVNVYFLSSSITIFIRHNASVDFDANMGAGARFGSCEDPDFLYRILNANGRLLYFPKIDVWHPTPNMNSISLSKVRSYSSGFGYFVRKDLFSVKTVLLIMLVIKKIYQCTVNKKLFTKSYFSHYYLGLRDGLLKRYK